MREKKGKERKEGGKNERRRREKKGFGITPRSIKLPWLYNTIL